MTRSGHDARADDLDRFAALGLRRLRYPVLWERTAPDGLDRADWTWADERLGRLRTLGLAPIVGLVHHGSGPHSTSLIDPGFPEALADYARAVAERYPWVDSYTPINEPLTTARFSGLYGHWYPHGRDDQTFARALVTQCRAVALAMRAIRAVNPAAQLVQTDDLGWVCSTPELAYQAALENERRWLGFDLLFGRVDRHHPLWESLRGCGIPEDDLIRLHDEPCPPDIIGINHYLSSERFLDHRLERYPADSHGGNGRDAYADVLAARVCADGPRGPKVLLRQTWDRYATPIAVTEAHNGCTREEQLRWFLEVWEAAQSLREAGVDIRAVTAWSLLGAFDWDRLLTQPVGRYEPGVFDLRGPEPRPTALVGLIRDLAAGRTADHPVLATLGWWRRPDRLWYPPVDCPGDGPEAAQPATAGTPARAGDSGARPILITGATGTLGRAFARICTQRGLAYRLLTRQQMDIADHRSVDRVLIDLNPWAIINTAGYVRVDQAEGDAGRCRRENAEGPGVLAEVCRQHGRRLLTFSSDLVFDGRQRHPYVESDPVSPLNVYGQDKAEAERRVLERLPAALVIRTSAFFGPWDEYNFVTLALNHLREGRPFVAANDAVVSPTYVPDLVHTSLDLLIDGESGIWHLANPGAVTWEGLARQAAGLAGIPTESLVGCPTAELGLIARRPLYSALGSERGTLMPPLADALARYLTDRVGEAPVPLAGPAD